MSCTSAGNCLAGGSYGDRHGHTQVFVASQRNGAWQNAIEIPGTGRINRGGQIVLTSLSCASAGDCAVGGHRVGGCLFARRD